MRGAFGGLVDRGAEYEVYAFEYATRPTSTDESYVRNPLYGEGNQPFTMGYYFWLLVGGGKTYLVDTGYSLIAATRRGRDFLITPVEALRAFGLDPGWGAAPRVIHSEVFIPIVSRAWLHASVRPGPQRYGRITGVFRCR